jgi:hypothetical protein
MANRIKLAGTTSNTFDVGLNANGNLQTGNSNVSIESRAGKAIVAQNASTVGTPAVQIIGNYITGGGAGQIQTLNFAGTPASPTPLAYNDYLFQIQNLAYTGPSGLFEPVANYSFSGDFAFHKTDEISSPTGFNYTGSFFQITQFGNDGTNDNLYDYNIKNGELIIGGFSPTDSFGPANTNFTVTVQDSSGATNSFTFLNNGNFSGPNNITANYFYGDGGHLSNIAVANVTGLGNIATINLDGNSSNLLYGNGTFAPISITSVANANYANFAGQVVDATQSNITSLGTLTSVTVSGDANVGNLKLNQFQETVYSIGTTSGTITPDFNNGSIQSMTLNGNVTINTLGNAIAGRSMTLIVNQDGTGNRTLTSSMLFAGNSKTLSTAASAKDIISVFYDGSSYWATLSKGYA